MRLMSRCSMALLSGAIFVAVPSVRTPAQSEKPPAAADKTPEKSAAPEKPALPPLPAEAHAQQTMTLDGKVLKYTVTVGGLPSRDKDGKVAGEVVVTAYTVEGENRPVTFAMNGGPGAASVFLNFGAIGPKHLQAGNEGDSPSDPTTLKDNPGTWLDFTDLVFIDPVGTGSAVQWSPKIRQRSFSTRPSRTSSICHA